MRRRGTFGSYSFARVSAASSVSSKTSLPPFAVRHLAQAGPMPCAPPAMMAVFFASSCYVFINDIKFYSVHGCAAISILQKRSNFLADKPRSRWTFYEISVPSVGQYSAGLVGQEPEMPVRISLSRNFQPLQAVFSQWGIFFDIFIGFYVGSYQIAANWRVPAVLKWGYKSFFILGIGALYYVLSGLPVCCLIRKNLIVCSEFDLVCCNDC